MLKVNYQRVLPVLLLALTGVGAFFYWTVMFGDQAAPYTMLSTDGVYRKVQFINQFSPYDPKKDTVVVLSAIGTAQSYGRDRGIAELFSTMTSFDFDPNQISIGLLVGDPLEYEVVLKFFFDSFNQLTAENAAEYPHRVTLLAAPFIEEKFKAIDRNNRHSDKVQRLRRRVIAKSRNFVLNHGLNEEKYTLFIDSDIVNVEHPTMLRMFISSEKDIIVPRIVRGGLIDYDKNSWKGERTVPNAEQLEKMDNNDWDNWDYVPRDVRNKMVHFDGIIHANANKPLSDAARQLDYMVPLDSVGGAILFAKSIIYQQGIQFPPIYVVGTTWNRLEGYDGIETEGLCYVAKSSGYSCWGMPNLVAHHSQD